MPSSKILSTNSTNPKSPINPKTAGSEEWKTLLIQGAAQAGLIIEGHQADLMAVHASALLEWNRKINLTAITDPAQIAFKHFLDALLPMPYIPPVVSLLDMGTGAGFPGIPLKIMRPDQPMTLLDASRKKINFVKHVLRTLKAPKVSTIQARAEVIGRDPSCRGRFQAIVCRAFADLETIAHLAAPFLSADGKVYVYRGPGDRSERAPVISEGGAAAFQLLSTHRYTLPILGDHRALAIIRPIG